MRKPSETETRPPGGKEAVSEDRVLVALHAAALALQNENGRKKNWIEKNPALTVAIMGAIFAMFQFVGQVVFRENFGQAIQPYMEETQGRLDAIEKNIADERGANKAIHLTLKQQDSDLAVYLLEGDRYDRALLERMAKKLRVNFDQRPKALSEAEGRVKAVRDGARVGSGSGS